MILEYSWQRLIFLLAGPSGVGKNTLIKSLIDQVDNICQLPSVTTRPRRPNEEENIHHKFVSEQEFDRYISEDQFVEWKVAYGHYYGTLKTIIETALESDSDHIADIDIWGSLKIRSKYPRNVIIVFVRTSTLDVLEQRLRHRGMLSKQEIAARLEMAKRELACAEKSDHIISNDDFQNAILKLGSIIERERKRIANRE